jgi:hypothetical protein
VASLHAADLSLLSEGKSDYQIVVPDSLETPTLTECLNQTARLVQTTFAASGVEVAVVPESHRDATKPALLLGNTRFAKQHGVDVTKLRDWSYVHRVSGRDIIIAGHDHAPQAPTADPRRPNWDRVGTAKAAVDFLREFMGVRFLYPELPGYTPVSGAARIDLRNSPAIEFLPMKSITVPDSLDVTKTPLLRVNSSHPAGGSFYDLAHNRFPRVDEQFGRTHVGTSGPGRTVRGAPGVLRADRRLTVAATQRRGAVLPVESRRAGTYLPRSRRAF